MGDGGVGDGEGTDEGENEFGDYGGGANEFGEYSGGFTPDLASFNENVTGMTAEESVAAQEAAASDAGGAGTGIESGSDIGNDSGTLMVNKPKAITPVSEKVALTLMKKKAKRRSLLGGNSSNVYVRSIFGS